MNRKTLWRIKLNWQKKFFFYRTHKVLSTTTVAQKSTTCPLCFHFKFCAPEFSLSCHFWADPGLISHVVRHLLDVSRDCVVRHASWRHRRRPTARVTSEQIAHLALDIMRLLRPIRATNFSCFSALRITSALRWIFEQKRGFKVIFYGQDFAFSSRHDKTAESMTYVMSFSRDVIDVCVVALAASGSIFRGAFDVWLQN